MTVEWDPVQWDDEEERSYAGRVIKEGLPAVANTIQDMALAIPSGLRGVAEGVGAKLGGASFSEAMGRGNEAYQSNMETLQGALPRFNDPRQQAMQETLGQVIEDATGAVGRGAENVAMAVRPDEGGYPGIRTGAEALTNFAPLPGVKAAGRIPHVGSAWRAENAAARGAAESVLQRKMAGESEYGSWEAYAKERQDYNNAMQELDNAIVKYPKDLQAPQIGGGGKVASIPDQVGKREKGKYASQVVWDDEMHTLGEDYQEGRNTAHEQALAKGEDQLGQYGPTYEGTTQEHAPSPTRPFQIEQLREGRISEGEATKIYLKPAFERTAEERLKLQDYEAKLREPDINSVSQDISGGTSKNELYNKSLHDVQSFSDAGIAELYKQPRSTVREQLSAIVDSSKSPVNREIAKLLLADKEFNPRFEASSVYKEYGVPYDGVYDHAKYKIVVDPKLLGDEHILLHEAVHARTHSAIEGVLQGFGGFEHLQSAVSRLQDLYREFKDRSPHQDSYGLKNIHEFIAEAFSNPEFQRQMQSMKLSLREKGPKYYWDEFVAAIGRILDFDRADNSFLAQAMRAGTDIMHGTDQNMRRVFETKERRTGMVSGELIMDDMGIPKPQQADYWKNLTQEERDAHFKEYREAKGDIFGAYSYKDFQNDLKAQGLSLPARQVRAMFDKASPQQAPVPAHPDAPAIETIKNIDGLRKIQQQYADKRPWEEVLPIIQQVKDVGMVSANVVAKIIAGKFTASDHPLWSWTSSQIHWIKNDALREANAILHGKDKKNPEPGTYNHMWNLLTKKERTEVNKVGWEFNNKEMGTTAADIQKFAREEFGHELSRHQLQSYQDRVRLNKQVLEDVVNKRLIAEGKDPIPALPNYWSPNVFKGPFLLKFLDKETGETVKIQSSYLRPNEKSLAKQFPDYKLETTEIGLKSSLDFEQLDWVLRQLHKEMRDPAAKAIAEGLRRQGFMKHGLKRRGVEGGEGSGGKTALRDYEETAEKYIRNAFEWESNRKLDKLYNQILDEKSIDGQPYAKGFALESIDTARGGANELFEKFSRVASDIVRGTVQVGSAGTLKLPQRFTKDLMRYSNKVGTTLLIGFGNLTNIAAQLLQAPIYASIKGLAMQAENKPFSLAIFRAMGDTVHKMGQWDSSKDIQKLKEIGALDPTMRYDWSTYASDSDPRYKQTLADHLTGVSALSYIESNAVRRPAALFFLHMLRELGYDFIARDKNEIFYVAKEITDQYMVSMKWFEKPHMFSRTGLIGTVTSPLQSFTTTWAGMLREYTKLSASGLLEGNVMKSTPLAAFIGATYLTAGMLGLPGIKEWDFMANWLNDHYGYNLPGATDWIMSNVKGTANRFGLLSSATGMGVGSTFNAPTLVGSFAIGGQTIVNALVAAFRVAQQAGSELGMNDAPEAYQMRDALKGVSPRFSPIPGFNWGDIEKSQTPEGKPFQDMKGNAGPVTRDNFDWLARRLGTYSNKEVEERNRNYIMKKEGQQRSSRLSTASSKAVDAILMDPANAQQRVTAIFNELRQDRFSGNDIKMGLRREILSKIIESDTKMLGKGNTTGQQTLIQLYQQLGPER